MQAKKTRIVLIGVIGLLVILLISLLNIYTEWLFFKETGYTGIFTTTLSAKIALGAFFGIFFLVFATVNTLIANKAAFRPVKLQLVDNLALHVKGIEGIIKTAALVAGAVFAFFAAQWGALRWEEFLIFMNSVRMDLADPILGKDIGFYLFRLPFIESLKGFAGFTLVMTLIIVGANYFLRGGLVVSNAGFYVDRKVRAHLGVLGGLFLLLAAFGFYIDVFNLLLSSNGVVFGAGYTDINTRLLFYRILMAVTPVAAVVFAAAMLRGALKAALVSAGVVGFLYIGGLVLYPAFVQKFKVDPNELDLETPYIEHNIRFTRMGYDLDRIEVIPFDVGYGLTSGDIEANDATIKNIRLWDHVPLLRTYSQLQQIRTYYKFADVDNDRYTIDGDYMQVMLSARELSYTDLPSRSWINEKLTFTHGYGLALGPVSRITREGLPELMVQDIPPVPYGNLAVTRPEIYYGELSSDYVVVNTNVQEFSYPTTEGNVYTSYEGEGGVRLDSLLKRSLFALRFKTEKILLSSDIRPDSRILYYRNILERVRTIAPFLIFDKDPYLVLSDGGRLVWMIDAYTTSGRLPYSTPIDGNTNYIRNSVKTVVDAYDGSVKFYVSDPADPVLKVYSGIFEGAFAPLDAMPEDLKRHIRYPQGLLSVQAHIYSSYHMTDPKVFYNKENLWEIPVFSERTMEPYYTIMRLPGDEKEEYILLLPYTPAKRDNLAAWLAARCDVPNYGKLVVYTFPRDRLIYGPKQIDARINQDSYISQQLTLWGQRGSQVIRGSLLVIPIENSLLYVQPLYLAAVDKAGLPELRRVIVAYENEVVMEENLELALERLFGGRKAVRRSAAAPVPEAGLAPETELAREAMRTFERALDMQRKGDWAGYGEEIRKLEEILKRIAR